MDINFATVFTWVKKASWAQKAFVSVWNLFPAEHSPNLLARRLDKFVTFMGPGGFATPDDVEAVESCQAGLQALEVEWSDVSRRMHREAITPDELQMRVFWRQWHGHLMGLDEVETADRIPEKRVVEICV